MSIAMPRRSMKLGISAWVINIAWACHVAGPKCQLHCNDIEETFRPRGHARQTRRKKGKTKKKRETGSSHWAAGSRTPAYYASIRNEVIYRSQWFGLHHIDPSFGRLLT